VRTFLVVLGVAAFIAAAWRLSGIVCPGPYDEGGEPREDG
jgi:hypothetical protein